LQATAAEARAAFFCIHPSDVLSKYQGESERYLKTVFQRARSQPRAIVFFDGMPWYSTVVVDHI
jgi:vacuolar protein-sorting-associated protein 4